MIKVRVKLSVSETIRNESFDLDDLGIDNEKWANMNEIEKHKAIKDVVDAMSEQPYWVVDSYYES